jgi:hypothetical protein
VIHFPSENENSKTEQSASRPLEHESFASGPFNEQETQAPPVMLVCGCLDGKALDTKSRVIKVHLMRVIRKSGTANDSTPMSSIVAVRLTMKMQFDSKSDRKVHLGEIRLESKVYFNNSPAIPETYNVRSIWLAGEQNVERNEKKKAGHGLDQ